MAPSTSAANTTRQSDASLKTTTGQSYQVAESQAGWTIVAKKIKSLKKADIKFPTDIMLPTAINTRRDNRNSGRSPMPGVATPAYNYVPSLEDMQAQTTTAEQHSNTVPRGEDAQKVVSKFAKLYQALTADDDIWEAFDRDPSQFDLSNDLICQRIRMAWSEVRIEPHTGRSPPDAELLREAARVKASEGEICTWDTTPLMLWRIGAPPTTKVIWHRTPTKEIARLRKQGLAVVSVDELPFPGQASCRRDIIMREEERRARKAAEEGGGER